RLLTDKYHCIKLFQMLLFIDPEIFKVDQYSLKELEKISKQLYLKKPRFCESQSFCECLDETHGGDDSDLSYYDDGSDGIDFF
ncbi:unnamed protein product, partial [Didymodactylos carnosus]